MYVTSFIVPSLKINCSFSLTKLKYKYNNKRGGPGRSREGGVRSVLLHLVDLVYYN